MKNYYISKSSCSQLFDKKVCIKNFVKFTGKDLCRGFFLVKLKQSNPQVYLKRLQHRSFPVSFLQFSKSYEIAFYVLFMCGDYLVQYRFREVCIFYSSFGKLVTHTHTHTNTHRQTHIYLKIHVMRNVTFLSVLCY